MSEDEQRALKAELLLEYEEAARELRLHEEKANRLSDKFAMVAMWLDHRPHERTREVEARDTDIRNNRIALREEITLDKALSTMNEIASMREKYEDLSRRKHAIGL